MDLKGSLFDATIMPLAGTALVVNIGASEAKVGWVCVLLVLGCVHEEKRDELLASSFIVDCILNPCCTFYCRRWKRY